MQDVLTLTPGGRPLAQSLGYPAAAVVVDNYTSNFVTLPDAGKTIPPWIFGVVVALPAGVRRALVTLTPTVPAVPGPPVPLVQCITTWTDIPQVPSSGHLLSQSVIGVSTLVDTVNAAVGADVTHNNVPLPAGTQTVAVKTTITSGVQVRPAILTIADADGTTYIVQNPVNNTSWVFASVVDVKNLEIELNNNIGPGTTAYQTVVYASPLPLESGTQPVSGTVAVSSVGGTVAVLEGGWKFLRVAGTLVGGSGNGITPIAAVGGQTIFLKRVTLTIDTAQAAGSSIHLVDGAPAGTIFHDVPTNVLAPPAFEGGGGALTLGNAFSVWVDVGGTLRGSVVYRQA